MIEKQEQIERHATLKSALASQLIEGLKPEATVIADAEKWARGEMTIAAAIANYKARVRHEMV